MRSVARLMGIVSGNWYLAVMIDKMYIDCDRCIATMMMMVMTTLAPEGMNMMISRDIKRDGYGGLEEKFKANNENRRQRPC